MAVTVLLIVLLALDVPPLTLGGITLFNTRGGSVPKKNVTLGFHDGEDQDVVSADGEVNDRELDLNMRSDDFYLEHDVPREHSFGEGSPREGSSKSMLLDNDIFYDAVDYESASSIYLAPPPRRKTSKKVNRTVQNKSILSFLKIFRVFTWKGFGLSCEKSVIQWNSFGIGIRVPVSSNFPEWDRNSAIPKVSTSFGLNYPYECKFSVTSSVPIGTALYGLMLLGKTVGGFSSSVQFISFLERLKKQKATDSIKRIGFIATVRYTEMGGLSCYIGPWGFYYPGQLVMQHLLPMVFSVPALILTILGLFFHLDSTDDTSDVLIKLSPAGNATTAILAISTAPTAPDIPGITAPPPRFTGPLGQQGVTLINKTKSTVKIVKKKLPTAISLSNEAARSISNSTISNNTINIVENKKKRRKWQKPRGVVYWHNRILKWAATKTTGLGYNMGMKYKSLNVNDGSLGSRIIFEIQSFYPFPKTFQKLSTMFSPSVSPHKGVKEAPTPPGSIPDQIQLPKYSENHVNQEPIARHYPALDIAPLSSVPFRHPATPAGPAQRHGTGTPHTGHSASQDTPSTHSTQSARTTTTHRDHSAPSVVAQRNENYGPGAGIVKKNTSILEDRKSSSSSAGRSDPRI